MATNTNVKKSGGLLGGLLIAVIGIFVLFSNEGRTVKTQSAINEALKSYKDVSSKSVNSKNDGKLIATTGKIDLSNASELTDSKFGIKVKAVKLKRIVEIYQWKEECTTDDNDKKTCSYEKEWADELLDSSEYEKSGHENPTSVKIEGEDFVLDDVKVGAFTLSDRLIDNLSYNKDVTSTTLSEQYKENVDGYKLDGKYLIKSENIEDPEIGDVRVSYKYASDGTVSILGVQSEESFRAFTGKKGKSILEIRRGDYTGREILESMIKANKTMKWLLRLLGTILVIMGIGSIFAPLQNLTRKVPVLSSLVNVSTSLISTILGLAISLVIIAVAWFRYRPVLSIILLVIVVGLLIFLKIKKDNAENVEKKDE